MHKRKYLDLVFAVLVIVSLATMYAYIPLVQAASMDSVKTTLSDSDLSVTATSTIEFDMGDDNYLTEEEFIRVTYPDSSPGFTGFNALDISCPTSTTASTTYSSDTNRVVECVVDAGAFLESTSTQEIVIGKHANPDTEGDYLVEITSHRAYSAGAGEVEYSSTKVYIINDIDVSARVPASLAFDVAGIGPYSTRGSINGAALTGTSSADAIAFGTLNSSASSTMGHELTVSTNASAGYSVTVQQTAELANGAGDTINSFNNQADGSGTVAPATWQAPSASLGSTETYGHMGVTSDDVSTTPTTPDYTGGSIPSYVGLNGTDAVQVMYHNGPSSGSGEGSGIAGVAYTIEISDLQEAGDYTTNLTYVCTPTY